MQSSKLRVLLIAEACNPTFTSVPLVGYNLVRALADRDELDVTVASQVRNRDALEADPIAKRAQLVCIDNERIARPLHRLSKLLRGGQGLSWTTGTAMAWPSYMYFEKMLFKQLQSLFQQRQFDIVHRITPLTPTMGSPMAKMVGVPMVIGPLNGGLPWPMEYPELRSQEREWLVPLRGLYKHLPYYKSTYKNVAAVISGSRHTATEVPSYFTGMRFQMPENGIDPVRFPIREAWPTPGERFRFITVGRLVPYKGIDMILEAMAGSESLKQCELIVVGEGPQRPALEAQIKASGLERNVVLTGWKSQHELAAELGQAQAFVFPSLREFGGGVVLEAMASGLPSIIVDYGGPTELLDASCGIRLPLLPRAQLVAKLRTAMTELMNDPEKCRAMSLSARTRVRAEFTWEAKAEKVVSMYRQILASKGI